jgi:hypothetical protein
MKVDLRNIVIGRRESLSCFDGRKKVREKQEEVASLLIWWRECFCSSIMPNSLMLYYSFCL